MKKLFLMLFVSTLFVACGGQNSEESQCDSTKACCQGDSTMCDTTTKCHGDSVKVDTTKVGH